RVRQRRIPILAGSASREWRRCRRPGAGSRAPWTGELRPAMTGISVIIPTFNRRDLIPETLASILAQTWPSDDIIVVDDGSTDNTAEAVEPFAHRIRYHRTPNSGVQAARNAGVELARHEWIALCDSDDLWAPDYLARQHALISARPDLEFTFANSEIFRDGETEPVSKFDRAPPGYWDEAIELRIEEGWIMKPSFAGMTFIFSPVYVSATMFRKSLSDKIGCYNRALRGIRPEDGEFATRCLCRARAVAVTQARVKIRKHIGNDSGDQMLLLADEVKLLTYIKSALPEARPYQFIIDRQIV